MNAHNICENDDNITFTRTHEFRQYLKKITDPVIYEWLNDFYGYVCEIEEDLEREKIYNNNIKKLYPNIWKETSNFTCF